MEKRLLDPIWLAQGQRPRIEQGYSGRPQKRVKRLALLIIVLLMVLAGCRPEPDLMVQKLVDEVNGQNLNGTVRLFTSDAVVSIGSSVYFSGQQEVEQWLKGLFADNLVLSMENMKVHEDKVTADYTLTLDSASDLGVASLAGTGVIKLRFGRIAELHFALSNESQLELLTAKLKSGSPTLTYAVLADPTPLRVSQGRDTNEASLTVLITNGTDQPANVISITFYLPEGFRAGDLTGDPTGIHTDSPNKDWEITRNGGASFRLAPKSSGHGLLGAGEGLSFSLSNILVNEQPGVFNLEIKEVTENENGESKTIGTTIQLAKLPPMLFVSDLNAEPLIVEVGGTTTLWWSGSDQATYTIRYGDHTERVEDRPYQYEVKDLQESTTFYLIAEATEGEEVVTLQRERTVTVIKAEPDPDTATLGTVGLDQLYCDKVHLAQVNTGSMSPQPPPGLCSCSPGYDMPATQDN